MRCLLDKVTAPYIVQGLLKLAENRTPTKEEISALDLFSLTHPSGMQFFIVPQTVSVLERLAQLPHYATIIQFFLHRVEVIIPARYFKRWARRLRDYGFSQKKMRLFWRWRHLAQMKQAIYWVWILSPLLTSQ